MQLMMFNNAGYALEIMFSHAIVNGPRAWQFVSPWTQICQGNKQASHCSFDFSSRTNVINLKLHNSNLEMTTFMEYPQTWKKHELLSHNIFLVCHALLTRPTALKHLVLIIHPDLVKKLKFQLAQKEDQDTHTNGKVATRFNFYVVIYALLW
jgi:hypothetical protein